MKTLGKLAIAGLVAGGLAFAAAAPAEAQHFSVGVGVPAYPAYYGPGYYGTYPCDSPYADPYYCGSYDYPYYDDYYDYYPGFYPSFGFGFGFGGHHGFHGGHDFHGHGFHGGGFHGGFHGGHHR